ncbi:MAG: phospho-N-acetylmuramoyl-pentapeptide-transferase [Nitrospinae bacterium]|nr:phospho-N-acetylmuramoyl-pentapeptide-transferase [Nitrospinota bacterium]
MLYKVLYSFKDQFSFLNVFQYISFRTTYAIITALLLSLIASPYIIRRLKKYQIGEEISQYGPESHHVKKGTPTMGGVLIIFSLIIPTILWADITSPAVIGMILSTLLFGAIGLVDDYLKLKKRGEGMLAGEKFLLQVGAAMVVILYLYIYTGYSSFITTLGVPFFKKIKIDLGGWYFVVAIFIIVGTSNAVNLTDGLDGLVIGPVIIALAAYMFISYVSGHYGFANYLNIQYVKGAGELAIFCGAAIGASFGFLWYNTYPAELFMGNVGSTALGGMLGTIAIITKHELLLIIIGGIFVIEALSVIIQVASFKLRGKRVFRMAPLHHHFEKLGWPEPKVIVRFWIAAILLALLSLSTLKLR